MCLLSLLLTIRVYIHVYVSVVNDYLCIYMYLWLMFKAFLTIWVSVAFGLTTNAECVKWIECNNFVCDYVGYVNANLNSILVTYTHP